MAFDKAAFLALVKERFAVAANPTFVPVPDMGIEDEAERAAKHKEAMQRAAAAREIAITDVAAHSAAGLVADLVPDLWPAGAADPRFDTAELLASAQAAITEGNGDALAEAAVLLLIASFAKLIKE